MRQLPDNLLLALPLQPTLVQIVCDRPDDFACGSSKRSGLDRAFSPKSLPPRQFKFARSLSPIGVQAICYVALANNHGRKSRYFRLAWIYSSHKFGCLCDLLHLCYLGTQKEPFLHRMLLLSFHHFDGLRAELRLPRILPSLSFPVLFDASLQLPFLPPFPLAKSLFDARAPDKASPVQLHVVAIATVLPSLDIVQASNVFLKRLRGLCSCIFRL
mmetsp:Transcript_19070/g.26646  ORF Transcript_19070/g.26646 Transcript_19070/m.26646 type:complete len:215 (-) Transcript_19070:538-1182(-)